jgi:membrane associated rhomboid family serine protease
VSTPDLHVVCGSCGSEVSPYVTECPYCGNRIRKRAPKLERRGDELTARETSRQRRQRRRRMRRPGAPRVDLGERPYATLACVLIPALLILVQRAGLANLYDLGGIIGPVDGDWWRYLASPFVYPDISYWFITSLGIVIFGSAVERRLGTAATGVLMVASGALGMLAGEGIEDAVAGDTHVVLLAGANGIALAMLSAWAVLKARELRADPDQDGVDLVGVAVCAVVLIMLPLVEDFANVFAGIAAALVGGLAGFAAAGARGRQRNRGL